jgi:hypothetical protein
MSDRDGIRDALEAAGFEKIEILPVDQPLRVGGGLGLAEAVELLLQIGPGAAALRETENPPLDRVRKGLAKLLAGYEVPAAGVQMGARVWLVTARRT